MKEPVKIVQIAFEVYGEDDTTSSVTYALDSNGNVWYKNHANNWCLDVGFDKLTKQLNTEEE